MHAVGWTCMFDTFHTFHIQQAYNKQQSSLARIAASFVKVVSLDIRHPQLSG